MSARTDDWNLPPPPGFQGLRDDLPLTRYERHLPHWRQDGATYFVTFRQDDALPREKVEYLKRVRAEWERANSTPRGDAVWETLLKETMRLAESWLDDGLGSCRLRDPGASANLTDSLHHFNSHDERARSSEVRYEPNAYVVMPNHVHLIVRPLVPSVHPLEKVLKSWKTFTARKINELFDLSDTFWQQESFDRIIRDEEHLWRVLQYIGRNPPHAGLSDKEYRLWLRPSWHDLGWRFVGH